VRTIFRDGDVVRLIDQTRLPGALQLIDCTTAAQIEFAIKTMQIRGAPAIGVAGAYGVALAAERGPSDRSALVAEICAAAQDLRLARPTAVNLAWAVDRALAQLDVVAMQTPGVIRQAMWDLADSLAADDVRVNMALGALGADLIPDGARVLTHCNAGALATVGWGTALGVVRSAVAQGKQLRVVVDETRPFLQGSRLTAWELDQEKIPYTVITDNMAGYLMSQGKIDLCIVGADRVAASGDVANKIGTYSLSVLAKAHGLPFYVASPTSTIDLGMETGAEIPIEERDPEEVLSFGGVRVAPAGATARHPAFDVTPAENVSAIITEVGVLRAPYEGALSGAVNQATERRD
jgi:methylthioribose-1-phosphate isomerase